MVKTKNKKILYIDMDGVLVDWRSGINRLSVKEKKEYKKKDEIPHLFSRMDPVPGAIQAFKLLSKKFDTYILSTSPWNNPTALQDKQNWVKKYLRDEAKERLIFSHHKNLNKGDYLIDDRKKRGADKFEGELILFGEEPFFDWYNVLDYLAPEVYVDYDLKNIIKNLMKKNKNLTSEEAEKQAKQIMLNYNEDNKERDEKRNKEAQQRFDEAVSWEFTRLRMDNLDDD